MKIKGKHFVFLVGCLFVYSALFGNIFNLSDEIHMLYLIIILLVGLYFQNENLKLKSSFKKERSN